MNKTESQNLIKPTPEGLKSGLKGLAKTVAKAAAIEAIQEMPGPPGRVARAILDESRKAAKRKKDKQLADDVLRTIKGSGDYTINYPQMYNQMALRDSRRGKRLIYSPRRITGHGDYTVSSNSIATSSNVAADIDLVPSFKGTKRETRIFHREYLGDVISSSTSGAFSNVVYKINPGIVTTFPWLSVIAQNFDQWRPNGIVACFKSTSSIYNGSSQALGTVIMASDYDLTDGPYTSKIEMENSEFAVSAKASDNILHPIECAIKERQVKVLKCRGITAPTDNLQWYDLCNLEVATQGVTGTSVNLGELWITYDISFFKEQLYGNLFGNSILQQNIEWTTGATTSNYFGTTPTTSSNSTLNCTLTGTTITFPANVSAGTYLLNYGLIGDSTSHIIPTFTTTSGCTTGPAIFATNSRWFPATASTSTYMNFTMTIVISAPSAVITLSGGTLVANSVVGFLNIVQINSNVG